MSNDDLLGQLGDFISKGTQNLRDRLTLDVTDLLRAVDKNDADTVARVLRARVDPNATDGIRRRALPIATDNHQLAIVKLLLDAGADPNLSDPFGDTPLYKAVYWENFDITEALLEAGADIHQPAAAGQSPLQHAQQMGYRALVELLTGFQLRARENQINKDRAKHEEMKEKAAAARRARAEEAARVKAEAEAQQRAQSEQNLRERYALAPEQLATSLLQAIRAEDNDSARLLLERVDDLEIYVPQYRSTPLLSAIESKNTEFTRLLIERGAQTLSLHPEKQHSALSLAVSLGAHKLVHLILNQAHPEGATAAALNNPEQLLSSQFIAYKDPKMLNLLLRAGADAYYGGRHGQAPVVKAIEKGSLAVLPVLVGNGVDLNYRCAGRTPLEWAIHFHRTDWVGALLDEEVDPNTQGEGGQTPLMLAVELNFLEAIGLLLDEEADHQLRDAEGRTALMRARELGGRDEALQMLEDA
ncbi:MAG: ankyrin repeat domain-containing protein [Bacteroidota bacterium]